MGQRGYQDAELGVANFSLPRALQGYYDVRRVNDADKEPVLFMVDTLKSILKEVRCVAPGRLMGWACVCSELDFNSFDLLG